MEYTVFGKPERGTYEFALKRLQEIAAEMSPGKTADNQSIYAIGGKIPFVVNMDNPLSDISGANNFGWHSILVKTGVWQPHHGDDHGAKYVVEDVEEAVLLALQKEGINV